LRHASDLTAWPIKPRLLLDASAPITPSSRAPLRRHPVSLAKHGDGPMVTAFSGRPRISDRTPRAALRIDHQLGTGAELPPLPATCDLLASGRSSRRRRPVPAGNDVDIDQANATHEHPRRGRLSRCPQYRVWVVAYAAPAVRGWPSTRGSGAIATAGRNRQACAAP
jgi:hypothetical protein